MRQIRLGGEAYEPTKVICVGRNFPDHAREMGGTASSSEPIIFIKPNSSVASSPSEIFIPQSLGLLHHEVELCALIGNGGSGLSIEGAQGSIAGWAVGIDFTLRSVQMEAKKVGGPWALAKGFDNAAVMGEFAGVGGELDPSAFWFSLSVNGHERQRGLARDMVFTPAAIISYVSRFMTLEKGDVIMCGTPSGVGEVRDGDRIAAEAKGLPKLEFLLRRKQGG
ncbi:MAG: fumarylacetoacetate hydrolase family protein [bacterium]